MIFESVLQQEGATLQRRLGDLPKQEGEALFAGHQLRYSWRSVFEIHPEDGELLLGPTPMTEAEAYLFLAMMRRR